MTYLRCLKQRKKACFILSIFLIANFLPIFLLASRTDQVGSEIMASNEGVEGGWKSIVYCPSGSYVKGYRMRVDNAWSSDRTAMNSAEMECFDLSGNSKGTINSHGGFWGDWYSYKYCSAQTGFINFMNGYQMLQGDSTTGAHGMKGKCLSDEEIEAPGKYTDDPGTWGGWAMCPEGTAICGFRSKVEDEQGGGNDSALNHILIYCCRLCDPNGGVFLSGNTCEECYYKCKTCSGSLSSDCNSCYFTSTYVQSLTAGSCQYPLYEYIIASQTPPSAGWVSSPSTATSSCGYFGTILGGYNLFGSGAYSQSSFTNIPPFFRVRVWFRLIKIDTWDNEVFLVDVNSVLKYTSPSFAAEENRYTGSQCGLAGNDLSRNLSFEYDDSTATSIDIKLHSNLNQGSSVESWGIAFFGLSVLTCDVSCKTCSSPISTSCLSCYDHASKQADNSCLCDDTYFAVSASPCTVSVCTVCTSCYTGCRKCTATGITDCQSCITGYYILLNRCYTRCPDPYWGNNSTRTCDSSCTLASEYGDPADKICKPCDPTCATCSAGANTNCRSCSAAAARFHQYPTANVDGMCLTTCIAPNAYAHQPTRRCQQRCPAPTWGVLSAKACQDQCPGLNYYKLDDATQRNCLGCDASCATCSGPSSSECLSCSGSLYFYGGVCLSICGSGKYGDSADHLCKGCSSPCKECTSPSQPSLCTACSANKFLKTNLCVDSCDSNQYKDYSDQTCKPCHGDCLTCSGPSQTTCLSCASPKYLNELTNECVEPCPSPQYAYVDPPTRKCVFTCPLTLYGNNATRTCDTTCANLNDYKDDSDNICKACNPNCKTCSGPEINSCSTCYNGKFLTSSMKCEALCADGFYGKSSENKCYPCTAPCLTCVTPDQPAQCLSCGDGYFLLLSQCLVKCTGLKVGVRETHTCEERCASESQYIDSTDRICKACDTTCKTCTSKESNACETCATPLFFLDNQCKADCPKTKMYPDSSTKKCENCHITCQTCSGSLEINCLTCISPYYFYQNKCLSNCPIMEPPLYGNHISSTCGTGCPQTCYIDKEARLCRDCDSVCETCFKGGPNGCLTCKYGSVFIKDTSACSDKCPNRYFLVPGSTSCQICDVSCSSCEKSAKSCLSCQSGFYPFENQKSSCLRCDQTGQYIDSAAGLCRVCNVDNCKACLDQRSCRICFDGFYLSVTETIQICEKKTVILASITDILSPRILMVEFSEIWPSFFKNFSECTKISIDAFEPKEFNYTFEQTTNRSFLLIIKYSRNIVQNTLLTMDFQPNEEGDENKIFMLEKKRLTVSLNEYNKCPEKMTWSKELSACTAALKITPELLTYKNDPDSFELSFDAAPPEPILNGMGKLINITIVNYTGTFQAAIAQNPKSAKVYNIELEYSNKFTEGPVLQLDIILSPALREFDSFYFTRTSFSAKLPANYKLEEATKKLVESSANATKQGAEAAQSMMMIQNILNAGSSVAMKSLMLMEIIRFLRFIDINYPPNVLSVFESKLDLFNVLPSFKIPEDPVDQQPDGVFNLYGVSPYILNNHGEVIANTVAYLLISLAFLLLNAVLMNNTNSFIEMILHILRGIFIWNFLISYVLSNYLSSIFYSGAALKWFSFESVWGKINFSLAVAYALFIASIPLFIFVVIRKLRSLKNQIKSEDTVKDKQISSLRERLASIISFDKTIKKDYNKKPKTIAEAEKEGGSSATEEEPQKQAPETKTDKEAQKPVEDQNTPDKNESNPIVRGSFFVNFWEILKVQDPRTIVNKKRQSLFSRLKDKFSSKNIKPLPQGNESVDENQKLFSLKEGESDIQSHRPREEDPSPEKEGQDKAEAKADIEKEPANIELAPKTVNDKSIQRIRSRGSLKKMDSLASKLKRKSTYMVRKSAVAVQAVIRNLKRPLTIDEKRQKYSIFLKDYKESHVLQQYFLVLDLIRQIAMTAVVLIMPNWPFSEILSVSAINFFIFLLLIWKRPYHRLRDLIQNLINETCLLMACGSALYISYMDKTKNKDLEFKMQIGWIIVGANMFLIYFFIFRVIVETIETIIGSIRNGVKFYKERRAREILLLKSKKRQKQSFKLKNFFKKDSF